VTTPNHCLHCRPGCTGFGGVWGHSTAQVEPRRSFVVWDDGACPMCNELNRIVNLLDDMEQECLRAGRLDDADVLDKAYDRITGPRRDV
jgi:hypothetical protein